MGIHAKLSSHQYLAATMVLRNAPEAAFRWLSRTHLGAKVLPLRTPLMVDIELSSACNLRCVMCGLHAADPAMPRPNKRKIGFMEMSLVEGIIDMISSFRRPPGVGLNFGGESLLHREFPRVLEILRREGLSSRSGFNTNAVLLDKELADELVSLFTGTVSVSIDGFKESHERIRRGSSYQRVLDNTLYLLESRERRGSPHPTVVVNLTRVDQSSEEIDQFVRYWLPLVDGVEVYEQLTYDNKLLTRNEHVSRVLEAGKRRLCTYPWTSLSVLSDGSVTLCCHDVRGLGVNISARVDGPNLLSVWRGREFANVRKQHLRGEFRQMPACANCEAWAELYVSADSYDSSRRCLVKHRGTTTTYVPLKDR